MTAPNWYSALSDAGPVQRHARAATSPIAFHAETARFYGTGLGIQPSHETLLRESRGIQALGSRAIGARVSQLNPEVRISRRDGAGTLVDEVLDDHPLKALLDRPHPNISRRQLLRLTSQYIVDTGEAYWLKVGSRLGIPVELHPVPPQKITPVLVSGVTEAYLVRDGDGGQRTLPADVLVRFYFPDPEDPWASEGYLGPAAITADSIKFAGQQLRSHYQHDATPKTVLEATLDASSFTPEEKDRFNALWQQHYHQRTGDHSGNPAILPTGYKLIELLAQSGADVTPLLEFWQDEMLMNYGVPKSVLGKVVSGDRSSAETNAFVFDLHAVTPIAELISDCLTLQLASDFDPNIFVKFEEFVAPDKSFELERENADILHKRASPNIQLEARGDDPVPWGERPHSTFGEVWYQPDIDPEPLPMDDPEALDDEEEDAEPDESETEDDGSADDAGRLARSSRSHFFSPEAAWNRQIEHEKKYVPVLAKLIRSVFAQQAQSVENALVDQLAQRSRIDGIDLIFNPSAWLKLFGARILPVLVESYRDAIQLTLEGFGITSPFVFTMEQTRKLDQFGASLVTRVNQTTKIRLARTLSEAVEAGESIDQMASRIRNVMGGKAGRARARTIARTEVLKVAQAAQLDGFETSGVVPRKRWNTSLDKKVRDEHGAESGGTVDGQVRKLREAFRLEDGERAQAPGLDEHGGPLLSAHNAINCRCFVTPVLGG